MYRDLLQVDFAALEKKFEQTETRILLGLSTDDVDAVNGQNYAKSKATKYLFYLV
jgi:hypothetical protein